MTPAWKALHSSVTGPKWRQPAQHTLFPKGIGDSERWIRCRAAYAPMQGCRTFGPPPPAVPRRVDEPYRPCRPTFHTTHAEKSPARPRILTVVKPTLGRPPRKITILLNRRSVQTYEQLLSDISEALGLPRWRNNRVRRLFSLWGREIRGVCDFFRDDHVFVAAGRERPSLVEVQEVLEELYPDGPYYHTEVLQSWERTPRPPARAPKADSGFHEESELGRNDQGFAGRTPKPADKSLQRVREGAGQDDRPKLKKWERAGRETQQAEAWQVRRKNEGFPHRDKLETSNALDTLASGYCRTCRKGKPGKERQDPPGGRDIQEDGVEGLRAQRSSGTSQNDPGTAQCDRVNGSKRSQLHKGGSPLLGKKIINNGEDPSREKARNKKKSHRTSGCLEAEKLVENSLQGAPGHLEKERSLEILSYDGGVLHSVKETQEKRPAEGQEGGEDPEVDKQPANELSDMLSDGPTCTQSDVEHLYDIGRSVGEGNFAVVRECRRRDTDTPYAVKIIDRAKLKGKEHMVQNEISIVGSLSHPNVVHLLHHYITQDQIYLVMELVPGGDLFDAITESVKFTERHTSLMVRDLCQALTYIHGKSIVHRDLKPENLLVQRNADGTTSLKLADFGLAMVVSEPIFTVCGTPTYVAPEILAEKGYGLPVDMWATGVIVYILLCGFPPFRSKEKDQEELFEFIQQGEYEFLSPYWDNVSDGARSFVRELLLVDCSRRLTAPQALEHVWVQNGSPEAEE